MSQLKKGAILNYTTIVLTNIVGLLLTPYILSSLGQSEYGIFLTIGALVGTISLLDFGLNNTIIRFVAKYRAENDRQSEENFLATTMLIYGVISILVLIVGFSFYPFLDEYLSKLNTDELEIAKTIYVLFIISLSISLPGQAFTGICYGYESFVFPKTLNIIKYVLRSLVIVAILMWGGKSIALVVTELIFNIIVILITIYFVFKKLKVKLILHKLSRSFVKQILSYSSWIFIFAIVGVFQWKAGHWVLAKFSVPDVLAVYGIGITLGTYYGAFSTAISSVFLPRATQMSVGNASGEELTNMMIKIGRLSLIILMFILSAFTLFGKQFVGLWVGKTLGEQGTFEAWFIALMIMVAYTLPLVQGFGNSILEAKNKLAFKAILYVSFLAIGTVLGAVLAQSYGAIGMMLGTVIGWLIVQNVMNFYYHKVIKLNIIRFFKELFHKTIVVMLLISVLGYLINLIPGSGWGNFLIKSIIYTLVFCSLIYNLGMIPFEKQLIKKTLAPFLKKIS